MKSTASACSIAGFGLRAHAAGEALGAASSSPAVSIDGEVEIAEPRLALAPVARHARAGRRPAPAACRPAG